MSFKRKIHSLEELFKLRAEYREEEISVVHCHGTFDLLHPGHLRYFQEAKELGDVLVVTITPDCFVKKGDGRPVFAEDLRMESIASLEYVDHVSLNDSPDAVELLANLKPDLYVKGPDYKIHENDPTGMIALEVESVRKGGGDIHYTNGIVFSSSELIDKYLAPKKEYR